jgi:hypothetical protein
VLQRRAREYLPNRIVAPWQIVYGFALPEKESLSYRVDVCHPG